MPIIRPEIEGVELHRVLPNEVMNIVNPGIFERLVGAVTDFFNFFIVDILAARGVDYALATFPALRGLALAVVEAALHGTANAARDAIINAIRDTPEIKTASLDLLQDYVDHYQSLEDRANSYCYCCCSFFSISSLTPNDQVQIDTERAELRRAFVDARNNIQEQRDHEHRP